MYIGFYISVDNYSNNCILIDNLCLWCSRFEEFSW